LFVLAFDSDGSVTWKWHTPFFEPDPPAYGILRRVRLLGNPIQTSGQWPSVSITVKNSLDGFTALQQSSSGAVTWNGELEFDPGLNDARFWKIELSVTGRATLAGLELYWERRRV
jgi:hypothetical protein